MSEFKDSWTVGDMLDFIQAHNISRDKPLLVQPYLGSNGEPVTNVGWRRQGGASSDNPIIAVLVRTYTPFNPADYADRVEASTD